jgi:hypothetical protein
MPDKTPMPDKCAERTHEKRIIRWRFCVSARFNVVMSDHLNRDLDMAAEESETTKSEVIRKALQMFLAARDGTRRGRGTNLPPSVT